MSGDEAAPLSARVQDLHDGGLTGNRGRGLSVVEGCGGEGARLGLLYAGDTYARYRNLNRITGL